MEQTTLATWWNEAAREGVWWAPWDRILEDLSAEEAAWRPAPGRHSIWELVNHMTFWREYLVQRAGGGAPSSEEEVRARNWQTPLVVDEEAWATARRRFAESHAAVAAAFAGPPLAPPRRELDLRYLLGHDCYHGGQIMYVRALLGKPPLES